MKGYVYVIFDKGYQLYKIGITNNIKARMRNGNTWSPYGLELVRSYKFPNSDVARRMEATLHRKFKKRNVGGEWFNLELRHLQHIESISSFEGTFNSFRLVWLWIRDKRLKVRSFFRWRKRGVNKILNN